MLDQKQVRRENYRKFKYKMLNQKQVRRENATTENSNTKLSIENVERLTINKLAKLGDAIAISNLKLSMTH